MRKGRPLSSIGVFYFPMATRKKPRPKKQLDLFPEYDQTQMIERAFRQPLDSELDNWIRESEKLKSLSGHFVQKKSSEE